MDAELVSSSPRFFEKDILKGRRQSTFDLIHQSIASEYQKFLIDYVKKDIRVSYKGFELTKYGEYMEGFAKPTSFHTYRFNPLPGAGLFVFNPSLVFIIVENFLGGATKSSPNSKLEEFSPTEKRIIDNLREKLAKSFQLSWKPLIDLKSEQVKADNSPAMVTLCSREEHMIVSKFIVKIGNGQAEFQIALPFFLIEATGNLLQAGIKTQLDEKDQKWVSQFKDDLFQVPVSLTCTLARKEMSLKDVKDLKVGDIILMDFPEKIKLIAQNIPICYCKLGVHRGRYSLQVIEKIEKDFSKE